MQMIMSTVQWTGFGVRLTLIRLYHPFGFALHNPLGLPSYNVRCPLSQSELPSPSSEYSLPCQRRPWFAGGRMPPNEGKSLGAIVIG